MSSTAKKQNFAAFSKKRKYIRYAPDLNNLTRLVLLDAKDEADGPEIVGLTVDESYEGCSALVRASASLQAGRRCMVAIGALNAMPGEIVWLRELEPGIVRIGIALKSN